MSHRTYSRLETSSASPPPTAYDVVTSKLHYYVGKGFEINAPLQAWYDRYQGGSPFTCSHWEAFRDPRETTYATYTHLQRGKEEQVDALLKSITATGYDRGLSPVWLRVLDQVIPPLRYPCHGLQMVSAYVGQMAPGGRITVAGLLQTGDELRRVQRLAYRQRQLQATFPEFGQRAKADWQTAPLWQPLRRLIETLLVTYDWGEAFIANSLVVKPLFDECFMTQFAVLGQAHGDPRLGDLFGSLNEDCEWHRSWAHALVQTAVADTPGNRETIVRWLTKWRPLAMEALAPFADLWAPAESADGHGFNLLERLDRAHAQLVASALAQ